MTVYQSMSLVSLVNTHASSKNIIAAWKQTIENISGINLETTIEYVKSKSSKHQSMHRRNLHAGIKTFFF